MALTQEEGTSNKNSTLDGADLSSGWTKRPPTFSSIFRMPNLKAYNTFNVVRSFVRCGKKSVAMSLRMRILQLNGTGVSIAKHGQEGAISEGVLDGGETFVRCPFVTLF